MGLTRRDVLKTAALLPLASACTVGPGRFGRFRPRTEQVLYFNIFYEPEYLDPALLTGHPDAFVARQLFEGLVENDPQTLAPRPGVASRWEELDDGRRLRFVLRGDARWTDGTPVTAHDFVYSWERTLRPSTAARYAYQLYPVKNARLYNQGRVKRVLRRDVRPRRPPFVVFGGDRDALAPTLESFPEGAPVRLVASNLRLAKEAGPLPLYIEPRESAAVAGELASGEVGVVLARSIPPGADDDAPGRPAEGAWVQLRGASGGRAAWAPEARLRDAFPSVDLRRIEGERRRGDIAPLLAAPAEDAEMIARAGDDDEVEIVERRGAFSRVTHLRSGREGWVHEDALDDAFGDRNWFYVEVQGAAASGRIEGAATAGWVPARDLTADASVLGVRARSDTLLEVELEAPTPYFLSLCTLPVMRPVRSAAVERYGRAWTRPENIVTNGPFRLEQHHPRDRLELVKSHTWHGASDVALERAVIYTVEDEHTSVNMYRAGYLDASLSAKLPVELVPQLKGRPDYVAAPYLATYYLKVNITKPPLDDVRVRRALNLAIDKALLTDRLLGGGQVPATHVVPPGLPGYPSVEGPDADPARARRLLAEAGFPKGEGFPALEYLYNTSEHHRVVAEYLQRQWLDVLGIEVTLVNQEWKTYLKRLHSLDYALTRSGWIGDYLDPNTFLDVFVSGGGNNETGFASARYDQLVAEAATTRDPTARFGLLAQAEGILNDHVPVIPLYYYVNNFLLAPEVEGFYANLLDEHTLKGVRLRLDGSGGDALPSPADEEGGG